MARSQLRLREREGIDSAGDGIACVKFPTLSGDPVVGEELTGVNAQFLGTPTINIARSWTRDGVVIAGATAANYTPVEADEDAVIRFRNLGTNGAGETLLVESAGTSAIEAASEE